MIGELDGSMLPIVSIGARADKSTPKDGRKRRELSWQEARLSLVRAPEKVTESGGSGGGCCGTKLIWFTAHDSDTRNDMQNTSEIRRRGESEVRGW